MGEKLSIVFSTGVSSLREKNSSFDCGVLKIAYPGVNRNKTCIEKDVFEKCLQSLFYCPVVCRYDPENDIIGSHDSELVKRDGCVFLINSTHPVGFVPREAEPYWEEFEDDDGVTREYLCTEVLLWKRQPAYKKLKEDGCTKHSMEIHVKSGDFENDIYNIRDFEFTALCLLGTAEPCFEGSELEVFSMSEFKEQYTAMMQEFKESFSLVDTSSEVDTYIENHSEGGKIVLEEKLNLLAQYGLKVEDIEFDIEAMSIDEFKAALVEMQEPQAAEGCNAGAEEEPGATVETPAEEEPVEETLEENFALECQFVSSLIEALESVTIETPYGEMSRYWFVDYDKDVNEVYCEDMQDWKLYGFAYSMNGDNVVIDFGSCKRKKYAIVDFDEGEQTAVFAKAAERMTEKFNEVSEAYSLASAALAKANSQVEELSAYKASIENEKAESERQEVFAQFGDLIGVEAFEQLQENCEGISIEDLEEKCFAIRGRIKTPGNFSYQGTGVTKIKVSKEDSQPEPYGGVMSRYGIAVD